MIRWIMSRWDRTNRRSDMQILWPACKEHADTIEQAQAAFMFHISNDSAWTRHYTHDQLTAFVIALGGEAHDTNNSRDA